MGKCGKGYKWNRKTKSCVVRKKKNNDSGSCSVGGGDKCSAYGDGSKSGPKGKKGKATKSVFKKSPGGGGKKTRLRQFCNTYPDHPSCRSKNNKSLEMRTGNYLQN